MFDAFLPSHSSILVRRNKPWRCVSIGQPTDPTRLLDLMDLTGIGRQRPGLALMIKESPEPLLAKRPTPKAALWIL
jgi:hypothetical protein